MKKTFIDSTYKVSAVSDDFILTKNNYNNRFFSTVVSKLLFVCPLLFLLFLSFCYFILSTHRILSINHAKKLISIHNLANYNERCKVFNHTHYHCLPNVFLIGASKCGTTSLSDYLIGHPLIKFVRRRLIDIDTHREVHRFDRYNYRYSIKKIELLDEWGSTPLVTDSSAIVIHYTPHYLYAPTVPFELKEFYPSYEKLKFIVMLRNPVDRALSSYWFQNSKLFNQRDKGIFDIL